MYTTEKIVEELQHAPDVDKMYSFGARLPFEVLPL